MAVADANTPPQKSQSLQPDTVPVVRHTSQSAYRTGDLSLGRFAVLADLRRYLQVPFDCLANCIGTAPPQQALQQTRKNLVENGILNYESVCRWSQFAYQPAKSGVDENATFGPLNSIISAIFANVPNCAVSYLANPNQAPLPERQNNSRPDAYVVRCSKCPEGRVHWFDVALPFEFKKAQDRKSLRDNEEKIIWSLHSIMREDPRRRFAFGITVENVQLRLWLSNRAFLAVSKPINFLEDIDRVISLFYSLGSASVITVGEGLGWDSTIERLSDGIYKIAVGNQSFTTTREIATYGADSMVGRGTRIYEATDDRGEKVAIKDSWREVNRKPEGDILREILESCRKVLTIEEAEDARKHFVGVRLYGDVEISGALDATLNPMAGDGNESAFAWVPIDATPFLSEVLHSSSTGNIPDPGQSLLPAGLGIVPMNAHTIPCRVHTRTVFHDVGIALKDVTHLADNLSCLCDALKALRYLHKAGWIHRDFSVGNVIWVVDDGIGVGKLGDFEYAKRRDSDVSHDVRTGTLYFMAVEVAAQAYLFQPSIVGHSRYQDPLGIISPDASSTGTAVIHPPFRMNFLHDIESAWWALVWVFFYHTDSVAASANAHFNLNDQWKIFQQAFPGGIGRTSREHFFTKNTVLEKALNTLSPACQPCCSSIFYFAEALKRSYLKAEASLPDLALDDVLDEMHRMAFLYVQEAKRQAGCTVLQPLPQALSNKKTRPEGDQSHWQRSSKR